MPHARSAGSVVNPATGPGKPACRSCLWRSSAAQPRGGDSRGAAGSLSSPATRSGRPAVVTPVRSQLSTRARPVSSGCPAYPTTRVRPGGPSGGGDRPRRPLHRRQPRRTPLHLGNASPEINQPERGNPGDCLVRDRACGPADRRACYKFVASCAVSEGDENCRTSPDMPSEGAADSRPQRPAWNRAATRSRGSAGARWPSRPVISSFATRALATASSVASTTAAKKGFICAQGMNLSWS